MYPAVNFNRACLCRTDRLCIKEKGKDFPDKIETDLKVDLKITGRKNHVKKVATLDIQTISTGV